MRINCPLTNEERGVLDEITDPDDKIKAIQDMENCKYIRSNGRLIAEKVSDMLNTMDDWDKICFIRSMSVQHRTLQQEFTKLCVDWFTCLSKLNSNQYDLRNEASVELAKQFAPIIKTCYLPFI